MTQDVMAEEEGAAQDTFAMTTKQIRLRQNVQIQKTTMETVPRIQMTQAVTQMEMKQTQQHMTLEMITKTTHSQLYGLTQNLRLCQRVEAPV